MLMLDVNVLVSAMREDAPRHAVASAFLDRLRAGAEPFGVNDLVLSGVLRILTHPRIFSPPTPTETACAFVDGVRATPNVVVVMPGPRHWSIFRANVDQSGATGNLVADAWHAALAVEHGCEFISDDTDFARFTSVRWRRPG